jgi:hypothetical protein
MILLFAMHIHSNICCGQFICVGIFWIISFVFLQLHIFPYDCHAGAGLFVPLLGKISGTMPRQYKKMVNFSVF